MLSFAFLVFYCTGGVRVYCTERDDGATVAQAAICGASWGCFCAIALADWTSRGINRLADDATDAGIPPASTHKFDRY